MAESWLFCIANVKHNTLHGTFGMIQVSMQVSEQNLLGLVGAKFRNKGGHFISFLASVVTKKSVKEWFKPLKSVTFVVHIQSLKKKWKK